MSKNTVLFITWVALIILTLIAVIVGESSLHISSTLLIVILVLGAIKAQLLVDHLMGLRYVAGPWRLALSLYSIVLFLIITLIYLLV
ncbi:MAG: cytochrome C oxidase subunit IV family protein [Gammaproteobacteria bacterium]|nr:cytochrome C oxidase subunit IV family protein [Gammaproteobacteria bacterium]